MGNLLKTIFTGGGGLVGDAAGGILKSVGDIAEKYFPSKQQKVEFQQEIEKEVNRHMEVLAANANEEYRIQLSDVQNARDMYKSNDSLQKIYAISMLAAFFLVTIGFGVMIYLMVSKGQEMPNWAVGLISTAWGMLSMKVGTITDFLFGSSKGSADKSNIIKQTVDQIAAERK